MPKILVKFSNQPTLELLIDNSLIGQKYFNLVKENYSAEFPIFRDRLKYTLEYMDRLAESAKDILGWDWQLDQYSIDKTTLLHKDIEKLVGAGFDSIPAEWDNLIHELHYCLHVVQNNTNVKVRDTWLQIEWFNDNGFELTDDFKFNQGLEFGDIKLQNPWVGHSPLQIFLEKDFTNISQTCKFHNFVKPGINIVIQKFEHLVTDDQIIKEFIKHDPKFVYHHGIEKIKKYIGYPVIGKVLNLDDLRKIVEAPVLNLERIDFDQT